MRKLSIALGDYPHVDPVLTGEVEVAGYELEPVTVRPIISAYRRMIRGLEFDVCELAPVTYVMALEAGVELMGIPVFLSRRFHHGDIQCAPGSAIRVPTDLEGRRMGVRAYSVSTGVWGRGVLAEQYGVDLSSITWVTDDEDHIGGHIPDNVVRVRDGRSLGELLGADEIAAAFGGNAGTGRAGAPTKGWTAVSAPAPGEESSPYPLFAHSELIASDYYLRTGIVPLHSVIVMRSALVEADPELPTRLYEAFVKAKHRTVSGDPGWSAQPKLRTLARQIDGDPIPYGTDVNRPSLDALVRYSSAQGLLDSSPNGNLFAPGDYPNN